MADSSKTSEISEESFVKYFDFFSDLAQNVFNFEDENLIKNIKTVKFKILIENESRRTSLNFKEEYIRCAYLLKYWILEALTVYEHFNSVYHCNVALFNQLIEKSTIRICCFGGGDAIELFSIYNIFSIVLKAISDDVNKYSLKLYFTVIDICDEWKDWAVPLVKKLIKSEGDMIDVRMRFIHADLTRKWGEDVEKAVRKADILTMVKFISDLNLSSIDYERKKDLILIAKLAHEMKLNSWIFFLDFSGGGFYKKMEKKMEKYQYYEQCQSLLHLSHKIHSKLIPKSDLLESPISKIISQMCLLTRVSSGTWLKCVPKIKVKKKKPNSVHKVEEIIKDKIPSALSILKDQLEGLSVQELIEAQDRDERIAKEIIKSEKVSLESSFKKLDNTTSAFSILEQQVDGLKEAIDKRDESNRKLKELLKKERAEKSKEVVAHSPLPRLAKPSLRDQLNRRRHPLYSNAASQSPQYEEVKSKKKLVKKRSKKNKL